jgi:hypothetical protein
MNFCKVSNITQIGDGRNRIDLIEAVNGSGFCILTDNLIEVNDLFKSSKKMKKRKDKFNAVSLSMTNNPDKLLKMKYSNLGYYFSKNFINEDENLKINTSLNKIHKKSAFSFSINTSNLDKYLKIYVGKFSKIESSNGNFNFSFFKSQFSSSSHFFK